jgi:hypothetical protein
MGARVEAMNEALADFDRNAKAAVEELVNHLNTHGPELIALARRRFIGGFEEFPEGRIFTFSPAELIAEENEEIADAIVYRARRRAVSLARIHPSMPSAES